MPGTLCLLASLAAVLFTRLLRWPFMTLESKNYAAFRRVEERL